MSVKEQQHVRETLRAKAWVVSDAIEPHFQRRQHTQWLLIGVIITLAEWMRFHINANARTNLPVWQ